MELKVAENKTIKMMPTGKCEQIRPLHTGPHKIYCAISKIYSD